jgi:DNA-binding XRE family transcriptional regulator
LTPKDFKQWRKGVMRMSQKEAAEALGLKRRVVQYYEKGERDGDKLEIPKSIRLACFALAEGVIDYHGPESGPKGAPPDPAAGTRPAPDAVTGSKKPKKKDAKGTREAHLPHDAKADEGAQDDPPSSSGNRAAE